MAKPEPNQTRDPTAEGSPAPVAEGTSRPEAEPIRGLARAQSDLARRIKGLDRLVRSLRAGRGRDVDAAWLAKLQEAVADLADAQHDTHRQLEALAGAVERLAAERQGGDSSGGSLHLSPAPHPATFVPRSPARGWRPRLKRWARVVLRSTLGKLRLIWDGSHPRPPWDDVRLVPAAPPARLPSLSDSGAEIDTAGVDADYVWLADAESRSPSFGGTPPAFVETARLLLATEELGFVRFETPPGWIVARELLHAKGHLDVAALRRRAKLHPGRVLGKLAGGRQDHDFLPPALRRPEIRRYLRSSGPYVVPVTSKPRAIEHRVSPPPPGPRPPAAEAGPPPGVMLWLAAPLVCGLVRALAAMLEDLDGEIRPVVVTTAPVPSWNVVRVRALERFTPHVYPLGGTFAEEIHLNVIHELIARHGVRRLVHAGSPPAALVESPRGRHPFRSPPFEVTGLHVVALAVPGSGPDATTLEAADCHLATSAAAGDALRSRGVAPDRILRLRPAAGPEPDAPAGARARLRGELGWPSGAVVVAMCGDFVAERRPEDFVALAHRLRDDERFHFLLAGDGPLAADLQDLRRLFGANRLRIERPRHDLAEILGAADVACTTAEREPFPYTVLNALLSQRPVVAAAAGDLPELLATGPCGIAVPHAGDLDAFEAALRSLASEDVRRALGEQGPRAARAFSGDGAGDAPSEVWRRALDLGGEDR